MRRILAVAGAVVADAARRKVMYAVLAVAALMMLAIPSLPSYDLGVVRQVYREVSLAVMYAAAIVVVVVLCANRLPGEIERRTVYNVLARPVARWQYLVGTWLGVTAVMGLLLVAFLLVDLAFGAVVYKEFMWRLGEGAFAIWLESSVVAAAAIAVSTRLGPVTVALFTFALLFIAHAKVGLFPADATGILPQLYPSLDVFTVINPVAHGDGITLAYMGVMLVAFVGWCAVLLGLGTLAFQGRDV